MKSIWKSKLARWLLFVLIVILFLISGKTDMLIEQGDRKPVYDFSIEDYKFSIVGFVDLVLTEYSLGLTNYEVPVSKELKHYFSRSLWVVFPAFFLSIVLGILKGILDYSLSDRRWNVIGNGTTWLGQSLPDFFFVITIQYALLISIRIGFPYIDLFGYDHWYNIFFPIIFLSMYPIFYLARITSTALAAEAEKNYVRTARALGASTRTIVFHHLLKNAMYTILSHFYTVKVMIIGSLPIIEYLTFYRGAGRRIIEAFGITPGRFPGEPKSTTVGFETSVAISFVLVFLLFLFIALWVTNMVKAFVIPGYSFNVREVFTSFFSFLLVAIVLILIILLPTNTKMIPVSLGAFTSYRWGI